MGQGTRRVGGSGDPPRRALAPAEDPSMGSDRNRPLTGLAHAAGGMVARALPRWRRLPLLAPVEGPPAGVGGSPDAAHAGTGRPPSRHPERTIEVRILALTDFHGALTSPGERDGRPIGGASSLAAYLRRER